MDLWLMSIFTKGEVKKEMVKSNYLMETSNVILFFKHRICSSDFMGEKHHKPKLMLFIHLS